MKVRRFIFSVAGDTLAYQPSEERRELYLDVHRTMEKSFEKLADRAGPNAPLCVIAHSMGSVVAHNYLYDMQHREEDDLPDPETCLERGETLAFLCTYGSPLAIWRLRFGDAYKAIHFPGKALDTFHPSYDPKWLNIYDVDDVIAYPISKLTERYEELAEAGYLEDRKLNVGTWYKSWNLMSHKGDLRDEDSLDYLTDHIADIWQSAYG